MCGQLLPSSLVNGYLALCFLYRYSYLVSSVPNIARDLPLQKTVQQETIPVLKVWGGEMLYYCIIDVVSDYRHTSYHGMARQRVLPFPE